jgi:hypothetical protein
MSTNMSTVTSSLKVPKDYSLTKGISQSQLTDFMRCRMKWLYRINNLTTEGTVTRTNFGSVFHFLLSWLYKFGYDAMHDKKIAMAIAVYRAENVGMDAQAMEEDCALAETVFRRYMVFYAKEDKTIEVLHNEELMKSINGLDVRTLKVDLAYRSGKDLWLMEHKTKGRIDEEGMSLHLLMDFQNLFYVTGMETVLKEPIKGVKYNIIRTPQLKRKVSESLRDFCVRVDADIVSRPDFYFMRPPVSYSKEDKQWFLAHEYAGVLDDVKAVLAGKNQCYRNTTACLLPFKCEFLEACAMRNTSILVKKVDKK